MKKKTRAIVETRSQSASGTWPRCGPDKYVAVQIVPAGVSSLVALNATAAKKRGIEIKYFGEGYRTNTGPKSKLGIALAAANKFADEFNKGKT